MKTYFMFWIKEEFVDDLFFKSELLFQFLTSYLKNKDNPDLKRQYTYITNQYSKSLLMTHLRLESPNTIAFNETNEKLVVFNEDQSISLHVDKKHLRFQCETLLDAEELLFGSLRQINSHLFIMEKEIENFGWISPVIKSKKYQIKRHITLSSYF